MSNIEEEKQQDVVEFLQANVGDIDPITLESYKILQVESPEVLFVKSFDLPKEKRDYYIDRHLEIYSEQAERILSDFPECLVLSSGMFGGKTTLSFLIIDELKKRDKKVELLIADVMGEDCITARSYKNGRVRAMRFGELTNYAETLDFLSKSDVDVILLDEFAFLNMDVVCDLQEMCFENSKNLILTGLNTSYLGVPFPAFYENSPIMQKSKVEKCYSFVNGHCDDEPAGTSTIRYAKINNNWILDIGLLPLVVSKELVNIVTYAPGMPKHSAINIFQNNREILENILNPTEEKLDNQKKLFDRLIVENNY